MGSWLLRSRQLENQEQSNPQSWHAMGLVSTSHQLAARPKRERANRLESAVVHFITPESNDGSFDSGSIEEFRSRPGLRVDTALHEPAAGRRQDCNSRRIPYRV